MRRYRALLDELVTAILSGALPAGTRLPPQRIFAYDKGMAVSTANRLYAELRRRGLVTGEVGRGTFVNPPSRREPTASTEPAAALVDLHLSIAILPAQYAVMEAGLGGGLDQELLRVASQPIGPSGPEGAGSVVAAYLRTQSWRPDPRHVMFSGNGRQGVAAALSALGRPGDRIGVEPFTYPVAKSIAARLGLQLTPIRCDESGLDIDDLRRVHAQQPLAGLYLQPTLHNPMGWTMDDARRRALAEFLVESGLICVEDAVYAYLKPMAPLAAYAPEHVIYVDSLSKRLAPGVGMGFLVAPAALAGAVASALRAGAWIATALSATLGMRWMQEGAVARIEGMKRVDATQRQAIARAELAGCAIGGDPAAYHFWLELPQPWRADMFTAAAAQQGVAVTPGSAFAVIPAHAPNALRVAISAPPIPDLIRGLRVIRGLIEAGPDETSAE